MEETLIPKRTGDFIQKSFREGKVVCMTGAGVSAESGIPTFRGKGGLWEKYDPETYAYPEGLIRVLQEEPSKFADFVIDFYSMLLMAHPNPAHAALAFLEKQQVLSGLITQNIDNLHQEAGSRNCIELHGNATRLRCMGCARKLTVEKDRLREMTRLLFRRRDSRRGVLEILSRYFPRCGCGSRFRIDVVLFGEMLPEGEMSRATQALEDCRALLLVGTSLAVYPAAGLPAYARERGVPIIEINSEPSALSGLCDHVITGKAGEVMPQVLEAAGYG